MYFVTDNVWLIVERSGSTRLRPVRRHPNRRSTGHEPAHARHLPQTKGTEVHRR